MAWETPKTDYKSEDGVDQDDFNRIEGNIEETAPAKAQAAGDLFVATAVNAIKRLAKGAAERVLRVNAGGTDLEWHEPAWVPSGAILMWSGAILDIPDGWVLCDGTNSTPDLRGRFIVGAGDAYAVDGMGGAGSVALTTDELPAHDHGSQSNHRHSYDDREHPYYETFQSGSTSPGARQSTNDLSRNTGYAGGHIHDSVGNNDAHENRPPYYALAYIMKT